MKEYQKPFFKPSRLTVLKDLVHRTIQGELHLPPWWLRDVGGGDDFAAIGQEFLNLFIQIGNLQPDEQVLEIGCGSGRMAIPLTSYLSPAGSYTGMDITQRSIVWCQQNISDHHPNFCFLHADLYNKRYNPHGRYLAQEYAFPFQDKSFDFILLTSVFTHLLPQETENYLREIARMLRPYGRGFFTFFLLNETQRSLAKQERNEINFKYGTGPCRMRDESIPESAVAYDETYLIELLAECGLETGGPVYYGTWSGRYDGLSYQDILLVQLLT
jgi:SAM-dependent methyltransferase